MTDLPVTARSRVRRLPQRASYDRATIDAILDEGLVAHVGVVDPASGAPVVIPMVYARLEDELILHGSPASRLLRALADGAEACLTVTLVDALVLARSALHHSMNYRSVVVHGRGKEIADEARKRAALDRVVEHVVPGRTADARGANAKELRMTLVVALPLHEASAKVRTGPPKDDAEDLALDAWAGLVPVRTTFGPPEDAPDLDPSVARPAYVAGYERP